MYVIGMIHNKSLDRWHPVYFSDHPHSADTDSVWRFKSQGHHTDGFETRDAALENIQDDLVPQLSGALLALDSNYEWDGKGVPAIVEFFDVSRLAKALPAV